MGDRLFRRGRLLLLLDGLDEVADPAWRLQVRKWIKDSRGARPGCYFAVTSRYSGWLAGDLSPLFVEFQTRPLTEEFSRRFMLNWFRTVPAFRPVPPWSF